ncbi:hypothetical protein [Catelliglobosispora koreensis]|uniref:hypothetical protein n=1 Tax=Catelliglobosispora koreensis TaxID=129052 RepID=UPI000363AFDD|nr:hypothetical protein [Catelliglobosispora koreensis]
MECVNWWVTDDGGYPLFVRTTWALLRSAGFLLLIWQVRRGRASAQPFALILSVTTLFALARLVVPRQGTPHPAGLAGFIAVLALCTAVLLLFYRSQAVRDYLVQHANRLVVTRQGIDWKPVQPKRSPVPGWLLTARVAALSYSPLMLVGAAVAIGQIFDGRIGAVPIVVVWFGAALVISYATLIVTFFLVKRKPWATPGLVVLTLLVLAIHLPLCWLLLGTDGLIRDGAPLLACAVLALFAVFKAPSAGRS